MSLTQISLELARTPQFPQGSVKHRYEFIAPLTHAGHIDATAWKAHRNRCTVTRFWGDEEPQEGMLRHVGHGWLFDYNSQNNADDEPLFKLDAHLMTPGAYVSITERDGITYPFRITDVTPLD